MADIPCPSIVDIEASGFGTDSYPIEIGVAKANGERYCALIRPSNDWHFWSEPAEQLHGITRDMLKSRGRNPKEVCQELNDFLGDAEVFSDALAHDQQWLQRLYDDAHWVPTFTLRAIEHIMNEAQFEIWDTTKKGIAKQLKVSRHRASSDAFLIQQTFIRSRFATADPENLKAI